MFSLAVAGAVSCYRRALCLVLSTFISFNTDLKRRPLLPLIGGHFSPPSPHYDRVNGFGLTGPAAFCWASEPITVIRAQLWVRRAMWWVRWRPLYGPFLLQQNTSLFKRRHGGEADRERCLAWTRTGANQQAERWLWVITPPHPPASVSPGHSV